MEKILTLALITAAESYRRRVFIVMAFAVILEVVILAMLGGTMHKALEHLTDTDLTGAAVLNIQALFFRIQEFIAVVLFLVLFSSLYASDRDQGLLEFYLTQSVTRAEYLVGKLLGGVGVILLYLLPSLGVLYYFSWSMTREVDIAVIQASGMLSVRLFLYGVVAFLLSLRWGRLVSIFGGYLLVTVPMFLVRYEEAGVAAPWFKMVRWPVPMTEHFRAGMYLLDRHVFLWWQYLGIMLYGVVLAVLLATLGTVYFDTKELDGKS